MALTEHRDSPAWTVATVATAVGAATAEPVAWLAVREISDPVVTAVTAVRAVPVATAAMVPTVAPPRSTV